MSAADIPFSLLRWGRYGRIGNSRRNPSVSSRALGRFSNAMAPVHAQYQRRLWLQLDRLSKLNLILVPGQDKWSPALTGRSLLVIRSTGQSQRQPKTLLI